MMADGWEVVGKAPVPSGFETVSEADLAPERSRMERMASGFVQEIPAAMQGVSPVITSEQPLGPVMQMASGERGYRGEDGRVRYFDPETQVILNDPQTGETMVYARTPEMEAGRLESGARLLGMGAVAGATAPRRAAQQPITETARRAQQFREAGVTPTVGDVTQSGGLQRIETGLANLPTGGPLRARAMAQARQGRQGLQDIAGQFGRGLTPEQMGAQTREGVRRFAQARVPAQPDEAIRMPASATTFRTKSDALYQRVDDLIPADVDTPMDTTQSYLRGQQPDLSGIPAENRQAFLRAIRSPEMRQYQQALEGVDVVPYQTLKELRTEVGGQINWNMVKDDPRNAALKGLYRALTDDMAGAARQAGPEAMRAWDRARSFYRAGSDFIERQLSSIIRQEVPERVAESINRAAKAKGGNVSQLRAIRRAVSPEEWGDVGASVLQRLGEPTGNSPAALRELGFNPTSFVTNWGNLSDRAKDLLFGTGAQRRNLERLATVLGDARETQRFTNWSNTGTMGGALGQAGFGGAAAYAADPLALGFSVVGPAAMAKIMANPQALNWFLRVPRNVRPVQHVAQLSQIARRNPAIASDLRAIQEQISTLIGSTAEE